MARAAFEVYSDVVNLVTDRERISRAFVIALYKEKVSSASDRVYANAGKALMREVEAVDGMEDLVADGRVDEIFERQFHRLADAAGISPDNPAVADKPENDQEDYVFIRRVVIEIWVGDPRISASELIPQIIEGIDQSGLYEEKRLLFAAALNLVPEVGFDPLDPFIDANDGEACHAFDVRVIELIRVVDERANTQIAAEADSEKE